MARGRKKKSNGATDPNNPENHADAQGTGIHHNSAVRKAAINTYFAERYAIERQIAGAVEEHVKPLRDERNTLNKTFRADLGINEADVKGDYLKYKRRRDVELFDDAGEADQARDNIHEVEMAVYGEGGQMEWNWPKDEPEQGGEEPDVRPNFLREKTEAREAAEADA